MARSSTTYAPKWKCGQTRVIRVPEVLADEVLQLAIDLDEKHSSQVFEAGIAYRLKSDVIDKKPNIVRPVNVSSVPQRSPFRYPGGKTWLVPVLRAWFQSLPRTPDLLVEPFAGGGIVSLTSAFEHLANHVVMAETDAGVGSVWKTILYGQSEWLANEILKFDLTEKNVRRALAEDQEEKQIPLRRKAFLTILRNRVQRGGIMAPGAGLVKTGENNRGIGSRWYPETLARRIREIGFNTDRLSFYPGDGFELIANYSADPNVAFYVDPPYMKAARRLYRNWQIDHRQLFETMAQCKGPLLMSYDNAPEICDLADEFGFQYRPISMKNTHHAEMKELLISRDLGWLGTTPSKRSKALSAKSLQR